MNDVLPAPPSLVSHGACCTSAMPDRLFLTSPAQSIQTESPKISTFFKVVDNGWEAPGVQRLVPGWWHGGWHPGPVAFATAGTVQPTLLAGE
jgi:hypothetical protein